MQMAANYCTFNHGSPQSAFDAMNFLKLNDSKTEFVVVGAKGQLTKVAMTNISIAESVIKSKEYWSSDQLKP